jgi:multidrug efflux system outer membrane protein
MNWMHVPIMISCILGLTSCNNTSITKITAPQSKKNDLSQVMWWKTMHDPILDRLINQALNNNNQVLAAQTNIVQAQAQLKAAYNTWLPTVNASGNSFWVRGWDTHATPQGALAQSPVFNHIDNLKINGSYAGFVPNYSVNILENISNTKLARASLEEQKAVYNATRLSIISQTAGSYFALLGYKQQLVGQQQLIQHLRTLRHLERIRHKDGANDYSALATIDQQIATNQAHIASIENSIIQAQNALQLLISHDPGPILTHKTLNSLITRNVVPSQIPAQVLQGRPDIMIARQQLNRADAHLGLSYSRFFPQFSLTGLLGGSSIELVHLLKLSSNYAFIKWG